MTKIKVGLAELSKEKPEWLYFRDCLEKRLSILDHESQILDHESQVS